jgi:hypothetical protein
MCESERALDYRRVKGETLGIHFLSLKRFMSRIGALLLLGGVLALSAMPALGQMNTAEIDGQVKDPSGALVMGATVVATHVETQQKYTATTNESGFFLLPQLPLGEYTVSISAQGFKLAVQEHVVLNVSDQVRQDFQLELGEQ